jgi:Flp pilus assembly protein TadD
MMQMRLQVRMALCALAAFLSACESDASRSSSSSFSDPQNPRLSQNAEFSSPEEALKLSRSLRQAGADAGALVLLSRAHGRYPQNAAIASAYGRLALAMGREELAAELLTRAVAADPGDWRALSALAVLDGRSGKLPEARRALMRARTLSADDVMVLNNLALSDLLDGRASDAIPLFRKALASPGLKAAHSERIRRNLAVALAVDGQFDDADRLAGTPLPRNLKNAGGEAIAGFMGLKRRSPAEASGWKARLATASRETEPAWQ